MNEETKGLREGEHYWRKARAERVRILIDGAAYYAAFRDAVANARHSIFIVGWDIDTRLRLVRDDRDDGLPERLGDLLYHALKHNRHLHVYVLIWDWAMLYAAERQWLPLYNLQWRKHRRLHFRLDDKCPIGASQHQKLVTVDDRLAFIGGFDLSKDRWDTPEHAPDDPRRINTDGKPYRPFHDVQAMLAGDAARALAELARERWRWVTGRSPRPCPDGVAPPWPAQAAADAEDVDVLVSRTAPPLEDRSACREIERLLLHAVGHAESAIYIENEYLTSRTFGAALARALKRETGPDVVLVLPERTGNWLEQNTMDVLRWRLLRTLREADLHGRLFVCYPAHRELGEAYISLHSKLMIVDDRLLTLGSANLSNRSMGFDTECNLTIEGDDERSRALIRDLRSRLLAEHLGVTPAAVDDALANTASLRAAIDRLRGNPRSLEPLDGAVNEVVESLLPDHRLVDPEAPIDAEAMMDLMVPAPERRSAIRRMLPTLAVLATLAALAAVWRWTPLNQWLDPAALTEAIEPFVDSPLIYLAVPIAFVLAGLVSLPLTLLVVVTAVLLGPWAGFAGALAGALLSAAVTFGIGHGLARGMVRRLAGRRLNRIVEKLEHGGIPAVAALRLLPVAPFTVVNLVAGAVRLPFRQFMLGSLAGLAPGVLLVSLFSAQIVRAVNDPGPGSIGAIVAAVALASVGWFLHRRYRAGATGADPHRRALGERS